MCRVGIIFTGEGHASFSVFYLRAGQLLGLRPVYSRRLTQYNGWEGDLGVLEVGGLDHGLGAASNIAEPDLADRVHRSHHGHREQDSPQYSA